jgi:DNA-binding NarL/FixJ family response regulator
MELRLTGKLRQKYHGVGLAFAAPGDVVSVTREQRDYLMENMPNDFEVVSGSDSSDTSSEEESSSDDEDSPDDGVEILSLLSDGSTLKVTEIAERMGVSWQSIRPEVSGLVDAGKISKNADGQYQIV